MRKPLLSAVILGGILTSLAITDQTNERIIPTAIQAQIPRHAHIKWHAIVLRHKEVEDWAILYSVPVIGRNDSLNYLEFFTTTLGIGPATAKDRIYLGGRGRLVIDKVSEKDGIIIVQARQHQNRDPISGPTKHVEIIVKYGHDTIQVSKHSADAAKEQMAK